MTMTQLHNPQPYTTSGDWWWLKRDGCCSILCQSLPVKSSYPWSESSWSRIVVGFDPERPIQSVREK